ncbi:MAG: DUF5615 family PIN-like protein [Thermoguttaceae bacterium]|nr:DUF5615 family PIN-like protein [Thermoguttaceae bacterium]MDW8037554.1 DUF5615 family PIN-like protein [Thermoguttaceae bacterium]
MKIVADENVDQPIVMRLQQDHHQVWYVPEMAPALPDEAVLEFANRQQAILLTADKDFGELVFRQAAVHQGVVLLRLAGLTPAQKAELASRVFASYGHQMEGRFTVIESTSLRIRPRWTAQNG